MSNGAVGVGERGTYAGVFGGTVTGGGMGFGFREV